MPNKSFKSFNEAGFTQILIPLSILFAILVVSNIAAANVKTTKEFTNNTTDVQGILLAKGEEDNSGSGSSGSGSSDSSGSGFSGSGSSGSDSLDSDDESDKTESSKSNTSVNTSITSLEKNLSPKPSASGISASKPRVRTEQSTSKQRSEIKFSETEKIKTRVEDDRSRVDVYQGGVKVRYELKDGRVIIKAETEEGEDVPEHELFKIVDRADKSGIKVATSAGQLLVHRNNIGALSRFPLQIDLNTNQLIASTSAGVRVLSTLPDQAVQNVLAANIISRLSSSELVQQVQDGNINSVSEVIKLSERNGLPVYEINGLKEQKLFGFIPVTTQTKVFVSAENGQPVGQEQSLLANIIDLLAF